MLSDLCKITLEAFTCNQHWENHWLNMPLIGLVIPNYTPLPSTGILWSFPSVIVATSQPIFSYVV